jgi:hypothetical protein
MFHWLDPEMILILGMAMKLFFLRRDDWMTVFFEKKSKDLLKPSITNVRTAVS